MNQVNNNSGPQRIEHDQESIDLIELFLQLWKDKVTIIVFTVLTVVIASGYLAVAKEKWTSTAIVTQPDAAQIASYNTALNVIYGASAPKMTDVQERVIGRFNSALAALSETLDNQEKPEKLTIEPSVKGQQLPLKISFVGDTAEGAQKQLAQYIQQVDEQIAEELLVDLNDNVKLQTKTLIDSLQTQEKVAQEQKQLRIKQITEALKFAMEAKVTAPQVQQTTDVTQDTMFLLGSEALASMIKNESTRPLVFSADYYKTRQNLLDIQNLNIETSSVHAYRYVMKPALPVRRDSPKKGLTLVLAVLLGGMIGSGVVLARNALRSYKPKD